MATERGPDAAIGDELDWLDERAREREREAKGKREEGEPASNPSEVGCKGMPNPRTVFDGSAPPDQRWQVVSDNRVVAYMGTPRLAEMLCDAMRSTPATAEDWRARATNRLRERMSGAGQGTLFEMFLDVAVSIAQDAGGNG